MLFNSKYIKSMQAIAEKHTKNLTQGAREI